MTKNMKHKYLPSQVSVITAQTRKLVS